MAVSLLALRMNDPREVVTKVALQVLSHRLLEEEKTGKFSVFFFVLFLSTNDLLYFTGKQ